MPAGEPPADGFPDCLNCRNTRRREQYGKQFVCGCVKDPRERFKIAHGRYPHERKGAA
jgi:hypothetical protein